MSRRPDLAAADRVVRAVHAQAVGVVSGEDARGRLALRRLIGNLRAADRRLAHRLRLVTEATGGARSTFTGSQLLAYRAQLQHVTRECEHMLLAETSAASRRAIRQSLTHTVTTLSELEAAFSGVAVPLRLREAALQLGLIEGTSASLLRRHASSVASYGRQMVGIQERILARAMLDGLSQDEVVAQLMATGSFGGETWRAWRIVRTETAYAYAESRTASLRAMQEEIPDLRRVIVATFDNRTAWDSIGVHGQVRALDQPFTDGAGRVYLDPPGRPNDREVTLPWRERWPRTAHTRPLDDSQREEWRRRIDARPRPARRTPARA